MAGREDIPHDRRLGDPIELPVESVNRQPRHPRDVELQSVDEHGNKILVVVWKTHEVDYQWEAGQLYEFEGVRGKRYGSGRDTRVELHSTEAFKARLIGRETSIRLFVMGDSHVGYRHRPQSEKPTWATSVDGREAFTRCLQRARSMDVDVVIHAGDIFDHHTTKGDRNLVGQEITQTVRAGIPFYYVLGNHDDQQGRHLLASTPADHLHQNSTTFDEGSVNLLGVDHSGNGFPTNTPPISVENPLYNTILVIHESPHPIVDESGALLFQNDPNKASISDFIRGADYGIDLVITGHLHVSIQGRVRGLDVPVLVTGPTMPISTYEENNRPSAWVIMDSNAGFSIDRQPLELF